MNKDHEQQFLDDIREVFDSLENHFLSNQQDVYNEDLQNSIFRDLHTIKGSFYMFDRKELGNLAHNLENVYDLLKKVRQPISKTLLQVSLQIVDFFRANVSFREIVEGHDKDQLKDINEEVSSLYEELAQDQDFENRQNEEYPQLTLLKICPKIEIQEDDGHPLHFIVRDMLEECKSVDFILKADNLTILEWRILLISSAKPEQLEAQFIFIDEDVNVEITQHLLPVDTEDNIELSLFEIDLAKEDISFIKNYMNEFVNMLSRSISEKNDNGSSGQKAQKTAESDYIKVSSSKIEDLMNWVSELVTMQATLQNEAELYNSENLRNLSDKMELITESLRETIFSVSLVPIKTLENRFVRLVNDLSESLGKKVELVSEGFDTELDKKIIANLSDPLLHIIRNSIDHGIETPEERIAAGKSENGTITMKSYYEGNSVIIEIADDGKGIDTLKLRSKVEEANLVDHDVQLTDQELLQFIFHPGLSTSSEINDVSGRGVGMDVVKRKIGEVRGIVEVSTEKSVGTKLKMKIPLSLSIMDGLLTRVGNINFVLPLNIVREIHRFSKNYFYDRPEDSNLLEVEGEQLPVFSLESKLHLKPGTSKSIDLIRVDIGSSKSCIAVDEIKGQIKVVLKPLGDFYKDQDFISGGTILGNGEMAFVLDVERILN